jgi:hypothetical protein
MTNVASTIVVLAGVAAIITGQTWWIGRALAKVERAVERLETTVGRQGERLAHIEGRLGIATTVATEEGHE